MLFEIWEKLVNNNRFVLFLSKVCISSVSSNSCQHLKLFFFFLSSFIEAFCQGFLCVLPGLIEALSQDAATVGGTKGGAKANCWGFSKTWNIGMVVICCCSFL